MKKRIILLLTVLCLLCSAIPMAMATEAGDTTEETQPVREANACGENLTWELKDGVLIFTGYGRMDDFPDNAPWADRRDEIVSVVFMGDVTYIGERAFWDCDNLTSVDFGDTLIELGKQAFISCDVLEVLYFPATFKVFGEGSLQSCPGLKALYCAGRFPSFKLNCLWDTYLTIYYSAQYPWSESTIADLETAFKGRVSFEPAENVLPPEPTEPTEPVTEPTEETTETPTEEVTEPTEEETIPATEETAPETQPTEEPTAEATEPETQPSTQPQQTEPEPEPEREIGSWIGIVIIACVLVVMAAGSMIFGKKGKYSR
jgi:hypothetical protein